MLRSLLAFPLFQDVVYRSLRHFVVQCSTPDFMVELVGADVILHYFPAAMYSLTFAYSRHLRRLSTLPDLVIRFCRKAGFRTPSDILPIGGFVGRFRRRISFILPLLSNPVMPEISLFSRSPCVIRHSVCPQAV